MLVAWEIRKLFRRNKAPFILLVAVVLTLLLARLPRYAEYSYSPGIYLKYTKELSGEYTQEKKAYLEARREEFQHTFEIHDQMEQDYSFDRISLEEWKAHNKAFQRAQNEMSTVEYLLGKCEYYDSFEAEEKTIFYDTDWKDFVESLGFPLATFAAVLLLVIPVFDNEYQQRSLDTVLTTKKGRRTTYLSKMALVLGMVPLLVVLLRGVQWFDFRSRYVADYANCALANIISYNSYGDITLRGFYCLETTLEAFAWLALAVEMCFVCQLCKSTLQAFFIPIGVVVIEMVCADYVTSSMFPYLCSANILAGNHSANMNVPLFLLVCVAKIAVFFWLGYRQWNRLRR